VHALVRVHSDISPGPHSRPGGRSRAIPSAAGPPWHPRAPRGACCPLANPPALGRCRLPPAAGARPDDRTPHRCQTASVARGGACAHHRDVAGQNGRRPPTPSVVICGEFGAVSASPRRPATPTLAPPMAPLPPKLLVGGSNPPGRIEVRHGERQYGCSVPHCSGTRSKVKRSVFLPCGSMVSRTYSVRPTRPPSTTRRVTFSATGVEGCLARSGEFAEKG